MQKYIGTKEIKAIPMNRLEYNKLRGWTVPAEENPNDEGYLVEYADSKKIIRILTATSRGRLKTSLKPLIKTSPRGLTLAPRYVF